MWQHPDFSQPQEQIEDCDDHFREELQNRTQELYQVNQSRQQ
jgi:hypothetical protein